MSTTLTENGQQPYPSIITIKNNVMKTNPTNQLMTWCSSKAAEIFLSPRFFSSVVGLRLQSRRSWDPPVGLCWKLLLTYKALPNAGGTSESQLQRGSRAPNTDLSHTALHSNSSLVALLLCFRFKTDRESLGHIRARETKFETKGKFWERTWLL